MHIDWGNGAILNRKPIRTEKDNLAKNECCELQTKGYRSGFGNVIFFAQRLQGMLSMFTVRIPIYFYEDE